MSETSPKTAEPKAPDNAELIRKQRRLAWNAIFPHAEFAFEHEPEDRSLLRVTVVRGVDSTFVAVIEAGDVNQVEVLSVSVFTDEQGRDMAKVSYPNIDPGLGQCVTEALQRAIDRDKAKKESQKA